MPAEMQPNRTIEKDALYYPYIHIRSIDWLKRALLIFPHVVRIVPRYFTRRDQMEIRYFENILGRRDKPLLRSADLETHGVRQAQLALLELLSKDLEGVPNFKKRFGFKGGFGRNFSRRSRAPEDEFHLHMDKPIYELVNFLRDNGLMWEAEFPNSSSDTVVHPIIGEAIMSTIAMACAQDEGFDVVTDEGRIHRNIVETDVASIYRGLVSEAGPASKKYRATAERLCELLIFQQCDVGKLTPERLGELSKDHDAVGAFRSALAGIADKIPEMQDTKVFEERLRAGVSDALHAWEQDKANMSNVSKEIFGKELLKPTGDFVKHLVEKFPFPVAGAAGAAAMAGPHGILIGAAGGFVVALVVHGVSSWNRVTERERSSPYRYLTQVEKAGVAFTRAR
jgi:hypothetical protein